MTARHCAGAKHTCAVGVGSGESLRLRLGTLQFPEGGFTTFQVVLHRIKHTRNARIHKLRSEEDSKRQSHQGSLHVKAKRERWVLVL